MKIVFTEHSWSDYLYWRKNDRRMLRRVNELIRDTMRSPFDGVGKPEPLKHQLQGCWSRRINEEHRLIYEISGEQLRIISCRYHY
ncbi:MAG: Txe/YoeB family addiction module toxin [Spirochaetes bacterium]|jgi:toxin YoeB|nr:Txe/YoeB family addiction module toxin [Spirochaetota bacterium]